MKKFIAGILAMIVIVISIPVGITSSILETVFRPALLTKPATVEIIRETTVQELSKQAEEGYFKLHPSLNLQQTKDVIEHLIKTERLTNILTQIRTYLEAQTTPFQEKLPQLTIDFSELKEDLRTNPPPHIPKDIITTAVREIPSETIIELPLKTEVAQGISTLLAWRIRIQIALWLMVFIPVIGIVLLLRKELIALCITLGIANVASGIILGMGVKNIKPIIQDQVSILQLNFAQPLIDILIRQFHMRAWIFGIIGIILITMSIVLYNKIEKKEDQPKVKKKLKGILKKGSHKKS
jgi:hypothetical protein